MRSRNAEEGAAEERCPSLLAPIHEGGVEVKASVGLAQPFSQGSTFYAFGLSILIVFDTTRLRRLNDRRSTGVHLLAIGSSAFGWRAST